VLVTLAIALAAPTASAQEIGPDDPGVRVQEKAASPGYLLLAPFEQQYTYLVDLEGRVAKQWRTSTRPGLSQQLTEAGQLVRGGNLERAGVWLGAQGAGGRIEALAWDGSTVWQKDIADDTQMQHHEIEVMPNGHVLAIVWERIDKATALAAGRDPELLPKDELWPDKVVEYDPTTDQVVWEWRVRDHLVQDRDPDAPNHAKDVSTRPERIDLNYVLKEDVPGQPDWNHLNSVNYNPERDEIVLSSRSFSEIWVIDHATTTEEAQGPAGDLLFRYGNPATYGNDKQERTLFFQHDAEWVEPGLRGEGNILVFNNGAPSDRPYTSADEVIPDLDANGDYVRDPKGGYAADITRVYAKTRDDDEGDFAAIVSSVQRLPNGNTLIGYGPQGHILEVTPKGTVVWDYENPYRALRPFSPRSSGADHPIDPNWFFQVERYPLDYPAFTGKEAQLAPRRS
jgi:hypothetical protein